MGTGWSVSIYAALLQQHGNRWGWELFTEFTRSALQTGTGILFNRENRTHKRSHGRSRFPNILQASVPAFVPTENTKVFQGHKTFSGSSFAKTERMKEFDSSFFRLLRSLGGRADRLSNLWASSSQKNQWLLLNRRTAEWGRFISEPAEFCCNGRGWFLLPEKTRVFKYLQFPSMLNLGSQIKISKST